MMHELNCLHAQKRATNPALEPAAAESLFREHVLDLQKRATDAYLELLEEVLSCNLPPRKPSEPLLACTAPASCCWSLLAAHPHCMLASAAPGPAD